MQQRFQCVFVIAVIFLSFTTVVKILEVISSEKGNKDAVIGKTTIITRVFPWNVFLQKVQQDDSGPCWEEAL